MSKIFRIDDLLSIQKNTKEFLMMDEVEILGDNKVKGKKLFSENFWIFKHHWPGDPNVPAVFQTEAMTQISSMLILGKPELCRRLSKAFSKSGYISICTSQRIIFSISFFSLISSFV